MLPPVSPNSRLVIVALVSSPTHGEDTVATLCRT